MSSSARKSGVRTPDSSAIKHPLAMQVKAIIAEELEKSINDREGVEAQKREAIDSVRAEKLRKDKEIAQREYSDWVARNPFSASLVRPDTFRKYFPEFERRPIVPLISPEDRALRGADPKWLDEIEQIPSKEQHERIFGGSSSSGSVSDGTDAIDSVLNNMDNYADFYEDLDAFARRQCANIRGLKSIEWSAKQGFSEAVREHLQLMRQFIEFRIRSKTEFLKRISGEEADVFAGKGAPPNLKARFIARKIAEAFALATGMLPSEKTKYGSISGTPCRHAVERVFDILEVEADAAHFTKYAQASLLGDLRKCAEERGEENFSEFLTGLLKFRSVDEFLSGKRDRVRR